MDRLAVISDPQVDFSRDAGERELAVLRECFGHMDVDAVVVCGDITQHALSQEWQCFYDAFERYCPARAIHLVPGNMDRPELEQGRECYFGAHERYCGRKPDSLYFVHEAERCVLAGISPERDDDDAPLSEVQLAALEAAVRRAAERGIPALVFSHFPLNDTIGADWEYAYLGAQSQVVRTILEGQGGKVVYFSGHIHRGLIARPGGSVVSTEHVTFVSTPSICRPDTVHHHADHEGIGTGYLVELGDTRVRIAGYDFVHQRRLEAFDWTV